MDSFYGAHVSIKNGIINAFDYIDSLGGNMIQIFISNPMSTKNTIDNNKFTEDKIIAINEKIGNKYKLVIHLPYVLNIAKSLPSNIGNAWWIRIICDHLIISDLIGSIGCVLHIGKQSSLTQLDAIDNMFKSLNYIIEFMKTKNMRTKLILETSSGQGTEMLYTNRNLDDLANFYNRFDNEQKQYLKICVDTCHIFVAGYDIRTRKQVKYFFNEFNKKIGLRNLALIHLNDAKPKFASRKDRHETLGTGEIGLIGLKHIIRYGICYDIPLILETPMPDENEIKIIKNVKKSVEQWIINKKSNN